MKLFDKLGAIIMLNCSLMMAIATIMSILPDHVTTKQFFSQYGISILVLAIVWNYFGLKIVPSQDDFLESNTSTNE